MAVEPDFVKKRKRKRTDDDKRKLLPGDRVEVRSEEDGFLGSWHSGTIIMCIKSYRHVEYDHLLNDDGLRNLVDIVPVSPTVDGIYFANANQCHYRGRIRPLPPPHEFEKWKLSYGYCVDAYYEDAWWEGVIYDHNDGSEEKRIFFPDLGDEMTIGIDSLRITQDWDELTGRWRSRGTWLFFDLIEEYKKESYVAVSVKQIWYDLREKKGFEKINDWTSSVRSLWEGLIWEVINDNLKIVVDHFCRVLGFPKSSEQDTRSQLECARSFSDVTVYPEVELGESYDIVPVVNPWNSNGMNLNYTSSLSVQQKSDQVQFTTVSKDVAPNMNLFNESDGSCHNKSLCVVPQALMVLNSETGGSSVIDGGVSSIKSDKFKRELQSCSETGNWLPAGPEIALEAEFCPNAITRYSQIRNVEERNSLKRDVKKHLKYLKWQIEYKRDDKGVFRQRYISPEKKCYYSLRQVCLDLMKTNMKILSSVSQNDHKILNTTDDDLQSSPLERPEDYWDLDYCPQTLDSSRTEMLIVERVYNHQAVVDWYMFGIDEKHRGNLKRKDMVLNARRHLAALGWKFKYVITTGKRILYYCAPNGKCYNSLRTACKSCLYGQVGSESSASTYKNMENVNDEEDDDLLASGKSSYVVSNPEFQKILVPSNALSKNLLAESMSESRNLKGKRKINFSHLNTQANPSTASLPKVKRGKASRALITFKDDLEHHCRTQKNLKRKRRINFSHLNTQANLSTASLRKVKRGKASRALITFKDDLEDHCRTHVLQSSKRVKQLETPTSSNQHPRTLLSWLIDNNAVLPRAKVIYCTRQKRPPSAEGRITREGIKCKCCGKVYTLGSFEFHAAGITSNSPTNHIFLEDGRSLLECQRHVLNDGNMRNFMVEQHRLMGNHRQIENDYICSVCHYGGELILCDRCPSSFHKNCLGLEDVPDGDWFCPSCCCRICGSSKFRDVENIMDGDILICYQCEHKYHHGCLQNVVESKSGTHSKENWFCSKKCEEIFLGLHKLLGKPIPVGNNVTWTLVKSTQLDSQRQELDVSDIEALSKLSIALCVMHECFEPVNEPHTKRDLVEDVIFNRGSELNRLNFRGFYTVLLEKNEELISVATVRIYGEKAAEVPLVGTRFKHRRLGMCRILMNELEKELMELGVQRLILPAIPSVLNTWTTSFGFSRMTNLERLQFVDYTFLDFPDTIMCQKDLLKSPSAELKLSMVQYDICESGGNIDRAGSSTVSEVFQAEQIEDSGIVEQRLVE